MCLVKFGFFLHEAVNGPVYLSPEEGIPPRRVGFPLLVLEGRVVSASLTHYRHRHLTLGILSFRRQPPET